jgi:sigma-B regulation protein RsbU (phosphoserine phosphatase)
VAALSVPNPSADVLDAARVFVAERFARTVPAGSGQTVRQALIDALHRPLRVCGVVRNDGELRGAPFWVGDAAGHGSLQIVDVAQVDLDDPEQARIFRSATHFNPVDLVCGLRGHDGTPFELAQFVDPDTALVTCRTAGGRNVTALERPGLWNGSMAGWNTACVEIPASTFAPVRTVFDLLDPQHQRAHPARAEASRTPAITGTVLVIDDQPLNQQLLARSLERSDLRVRIASDGDRGLELVQREPIDLVLLDIVLPGLDGYEILSRLLGDPATKDVPVILMSSLDTVADKVRGMELGASDYITKPFDPQEVLARVRAQLRIRSLAASLARSHEQLVQREQRMLEELRAAAEVQKSLLPSVSLSNARLDSGSVFEPSLAIGGDIFNIIPLASGSTLVYMADVSGHGVASALLTMSLTQWLTSFVGLRNLAEVPPPATVLTALETEFPFERFDKYFSIVIATIDPVSGMVRYSAAGHPPPLVIRQSGAVERLEAGGPVIGMGFGLTFDEGRCDLAAGDRIVFYTDGVVEDLDADGERFGQDRLVRHFVDRPDLSLAELCWNLGAMLRVRRGDAPAADDIALLAFERR